MLTNNTRLRFLVISYCDGKQQWFYDFVVASCEQAAVEQVCKQRSSIIALDVISPETLRCLAHVALQDDLYH